MKVTVLNSQGKSGETKLELQDEVWSVGENNDLVAQALYVYRANSRKGTAHAKTRGEVRGGGRKPWKQKGTGRARQGSIRSPLWTKGGVAFPPRSNKRMLKMSNTMKHKAICCALSDRMRADSVMILSSFDCVKDGKTKEMEQLIAALKLESGSVLFLARSEDNRERVLQASRNIENVAVCGPEELNIYDTAFSKYIVLVPEAVKVLESRLIKKK